MNETQVDVVLFDLGGVLIDFGGVGPMRELADIDSDEELWRRWLTCPWVRRFERGQCSPEDFAFGVVNDWKLAVSPSSFLGAFGSWPGGPLTGAAELVNSVRKSVPAGCLSNTNTLHWELHSANWPILEMFDFRFLSFELGMVKPDRELFERVGQLLPVPRERVLLLDDNVVNVESAKAAGFAAVEARGVAGARKALTELGVLRS